MFTNIELKNIINAYNIMKRDLHTLLVKGGKSPLDYEGDADMCPQVASFSYPIHEDNQSHETYRTLIDIGKAIENMLKIDARFWNKTQGVKSIQVAPDHRCETVILEVVFQE